MEKGIFDLSGFESKSSNDPITESNSVTESAEMTLTAQQYKSVMAQLQKSFNEGVAIMDKLSKATVVDTDPETAQAQYTEEVMAEAYLQSLEDGPIFEAVQKEDKDQIKEITRKIRSKVASICKEYGLKFYKTSLLVRTGYKDSDPLLAGLTGSTSGNVTDVTGAITGAITGNTKLTGSMRSLKTKEINWFTTRLFQLVGMVLIDPNDIDDLIKNLNNEFADELDEFKIVSAIAIPSLLDVFRTKFSWKNMDEKKAYMLLIDRPSKVKKKAIKESADEDIDLLDMSIDETAEFQGVKPEYNTNKEDLNDETWNKQINAFKKSFKEAVNEAIDSIE